MILAKTCLWHVVTTMASVNGDESMPPVKMILAAFPERELAENYAHGTDWGIEEKLITFTP